MMRRIALLLAAPLALSACIKEELRVDETWVRLGAATGAPGAAFFTVHGGPNADRLLTINSPVVIRSELHESMTVNNMASMKPLDGGVAVPAKGKVEFKPGGLHAMLIGVNPAIKPGMTAQLVFNFASGERIIVDAPVSAAGTTH